MISGFEFQPSLSSDTVLLRPLTQDHFAGLQRCAGDLATWADYPTAALRETGDLSSWFSNGVTDAKALVILDAKTSEIMGTTRYYAVPDEPNAVGIGYTFIGAAFRNSGQTNAVLKQMMFAHAFNAVEAVWFHVLPENLRSQAAVKKLGVTALGQQTLHLTDMPRAFACFRLEKAKWLERQSR